MSGRRARKLRREFAKTYYANAHGIALGGSHWRAFKRAYSRHGRPPFVVPRLR